MHKKFIKNSSLIICDKRKSCIPFFLHPKPPKNIKIIKDIPIIKFYSMC